MNLSYRILLLDIAFLASLPSAFALMVPHVFGDHMVLQAGQPVPVTSAQVAEPRVVRFAWDEGVIPNFFNKAGLPAVPFRTDNPFTQAPSVEHLTGH